MKNFKVFASAVVPFLLAGIVLAGCDRSSPNAIDDLSSQEEVTLDALAKKGGKHHQKYDADAGTSSGSFILWAEKDDDAGVVNISNDADNFYVEYNTNGTADLREVHVYIWTDEASIPKKRPAPGKAPYKAGRINADAYTVTIPRADVGVDVVYISAHAELKKDAPGDDGADDLSNTNARESAYAGGDAVPDGFPKGKGAWWGYVSYQAQNVEVFYSLSGSFAVNGACTPTYEITLWSESGPTTITTTDPAYVFNDLPAGSYVLEVWAIFPAPPPAPPANLLVANFSFVLSENAEFNFNVECPSVDPPPPPFPGPGL